jgi:hypothetical protein
VTRDEKLRVRTGQGGDGAIQPRAKGRPPSAVPPGKVLDSKAVLGLPRASRIEMVPKDRQMRNVPPFAQADGRPGAPRVSVPPGNAGYNLVAIPSRVGCIEVLSGNGKGVHNPVEAGSERRPGAAIPLRDIPGDHVADRLKGTADIEMAGIVHDDGVRETALASDRQRPGRTARPVVVGELGLGGGCHLRYEQRQ